MASIRSPLVASSRASESVAVLACALAGLLALVRASPLAGPLSDAPAGLLSLVLARELSTVLAVELAGELASLRAVRRGLAPVGGVELWITSLSEATGWAFGPKNNEPAANSLASSS